MTTNLMAMMTAKGLNYEKAGKGIVGGIPTLTAQDVAGALGMADISREAYLYGLLKYTEDKKVIHELDKLTQHAVILFALKQGWREPFPDDKKRSLFFFLQMGRLVINELVEENRCNTCSGTGVVASKRRKCTCDNGKKPMSFLKQSKFCGMPYKTWYTNWKDRYKECVKEFQKWDVEIINALSKKLNDFQIN